MLNEMKEVKACQSALWKVWSQCPGGPSKRQARARDSCTMNEVR